jgi:3-methyladenine DNA glycosylase AlkD
MLMDYYIDDEYIDKTLDILSKTDTDFYYVNMATAWALSVAFVKYKEKVLNLLKSKTLTKTVQNMTIQKIRESNRVSKEDKELVKAFKVL